jgi:Holliday junction resolvase RusA-like endonuclease
MKVKCLKISLPMPPSVNSIWKRGRNGQYLSKEAVAWYQEAVPKTNVEKNHQGMQNLQGKVVVEYSLYYKDKRKQDADNRFKLLGDLLQKCGVVQNDSQILPRCIDFQVRPSNPGVDLRVYEKP